MRKLGEQWIEEIDGKKHMLKAVNYSDGCNGCIFLRYDPDEFYTCNRGRLGCPADDGMIIKDLGILNDDGCLPCPFCGKYPEHIVDEFGGHQLFCDGESHYCGVGSFKTEQEAVDEWNKRA